jgi:ribosomal-protein-alanine N-acetyltransferase
MTELILRYMRPVDINQVVAIDAQSFDPPWSVRSYHFEISESSYSHMVVLAEETHGGPNGWRRWFGRLNQPGGMILGYGGLWCIQDEGHISTIASHPEYRGLGYGEVLLAGMVRRAITLSASYVVLEVRVSNTLAQNLYRKYEFETVEVKPNYYRSDNEDAYEMRLDLRDRAMLRRFDERFDAIQSRRPFIDEFTEVTVIRR